MAADKLEELARTELQKGRLERAATLYEQALRDRPNDSWLWFDLAMVRLKAEQGGLASEALDQAIICNPANIVALLQKGAMHHRQGRASDSLHFFFRALKVAKELPFDGRPHHVRQQLQFAQQAVSTYLRPRLDAVLKKHPSAERVAAAVAGYLGMSIIRPAHPKWAPGVLFIPGLRPQAFYEASTLPFLADAAAQSLSIKEEFQALMARTRPVPYVNFSQGTAAAAAWNDLNGSLKWSALHLFRNGQSVAENGEHCPKTLAWLRKLDLVDIPGYGPEVLFSVLDARARIKPHFGSTNARLTVHIPLLVPKDCGALRVADQQCEWRPGVPIVFDDSFEHEAWNHSTEPRTVLIFDIWNPQLSLVERSAVRAVLCEIQAFERELLGELASFANAR